MPEPGRFTCTITLADGGTVTITDRPGDVEMVDLESSGVQGAPAHEVTDWSAAAVIISGLVEQAGRHAMLTDRATR